MAYPYDKGSARERYVPVELARELAAQRDELVQNIHRLRRENDRLEAMLNAAAIERDELELRALDAEEEADRLREELAEATASPEPAEDSAPDEVAEQADRVGRLRDRVQRLTEDLDRVRARTSEAVDLARTEERRRLLSGLGDVLDSVERGLDAASEESPWRAGLLGIQSQLHAFMRAQGVTLTGEVGEKLDPRVHEAVEVVETDDAVPGEIVGILRHGIELEDGTVARTAQVVVAG